MVAWTSEPIADGSQLWGLQLAPDFFIPVPTAGQLIGEVSGMVDRTGQDVAAVPGNVAGAVSDAVGGVTGAAGRVADNAAMNVFIWGGAAILAALALRKVTS